MFKEPVEFNLPSGRFGELLPCPVTGAAFPKARKKVKASLFKELCQMSVDFYLKAAGKKRWKSLLVGSTCTLPRSKDIKCFFGVDPINKFGLEHYWTV